MDHVSLYIRYFYFWQLLTNSKRNIAPEAEPFGPVPPAPALPDLPTPIRVIEEPFPIYGLRK